MRLWDNHMHSAFSGDSEANPLDMIEAAKAKGLAGMTFTDHLDLDFFDEPGVFDLDLPDYYEKQHAIALDASTEDFTVLTGVEVGLMPSVADRNNALLSGIDFDFILGSTHQVDNHDPYFDSFWAGKNEKDLFIRYYESVLENINTFDNFDSLAHLDYIFRYSRVDKTQDTYTPYRDLVDAVLEKIIKMDKALEINTGAYIKAMPEPNPGSAIIKRYHEMGGRLITLGADAHEPKNVAIGFEKLPAILSDAGFKEFYVYKKRVPHAVALS